METDTRESGVASFYALAYPAGWNAINWEPLPQVLSPGSACFLRPFCGDMVQPEKVERTP